MIQVYVIGGIFDKEYNYILGSFFFWDIYLFSMFEWGRCMFDVNIKMLMMIDSMEMMEEDWEIIVYNCQCCLYDKIFIMYGIDKVVEMV